jgi:hypothetical protein
MKRLLTVLVAIACVVLLRPGPSGARAAAPTGPVSLRILPAAQFDALPDAATVELDGKVMTKRQFLDEMERKHLAAKGRVSLGSRAPETFDAFRARILNVHNQKIAAANQVAQGQNMANVGGAVGVAPTATPDTCMSPKIQAISAAPPLAPGEELIVNGCGFGPKGGELRLVGNFPPKGYVTLALMKPWSGYALSARVPPVSGADQDKSARLQVVTKDLHVSNTLQVGFEPTPGFALLTPGDVFVKCAAAGRDTCPGYSYGYGWTVGALHAVNNAFFDGTDTVSVDLKNHWKIDGYGWEWEGRSATLDVQGYTDGAAKETLTFHMQIWTSLLQGGLIYRWNLYATGPLGVSMH